MSEVFEDYECQYYALFASLSRNCSTAAHVDGDQKNQKVSEIKNDIDEAESLIRKMDLEARSLQPNVKAELLVKLSEYKSDMNNLKSELKTITTLNPSQAEREELLDSGMADTSKDFADEMGSLSSSTKRLNQSTDLIEEKRRIMKETEEIALSVLQNLHEQGESLAKAYNKIKEVDDEIVKSINILKAMSKRMRKNKWIIGGIFVTLVAAITIDRTFRKK